MRCALSYDENKELSEQSLSAWGEMQSLDEDPGYKEADIASEKERAYFKGFKAACDSVCHDLDALVDDEEISEEASGNIQALMAGELAMQLFSILDYQEDAAGVNFGEALEALKAGKKCRRAGWNGKGIYIEMQKPDEHSKMTLPYIYIVTTQLITDNPAAPKGVVPWLASQTDMLAEDWEIIE